MASDRAAQSVPRDILSRGTLAKVVKLTRLGPASGQREAGLSDSGCKAFGRKSDQAPATPPGEMSPATSACRKTKSGPDERAVRLSPETNAAADGEDQRPTVRLALSACRDALWGVAQISVVTNLLMLAGPLFMLQIYDRVLPSGSIPTLVALFAIVACVFVFVGVLEVIRSRVLVRAGVRIDRILRASVFDDVVRIAPVTETGRRAVVIQDLERVRQFVSSPSAVAVFDLPLAPIYFIAIFMLHWGLGVLALVGAAILLAFSVLNQVLAQRSIALAARQSEASLALADAAARNAESVNAMGMRGFYRARWLSAYRRSVDTQTEASDIAGAFYVAIKVTRLFLQALVLAVGAFLAISGQITPGVMVAASIIMARALAPIEQLIGHWRGFIATRSSLKRLSDHVDGMEGPGNRFALPEPIGTVSLEGIYAAPPGLAEPVLKGVDFKLEPGSVLGVIGSSGSGKSTLARVLVGIWAPIRGTVRLDGASLLHWRSEQLGRNVGYLAQDIELFDGTVAENISRFDPARDEAQLFAAARLADVHELVLSLPEGYNTRIGGGGMKLSGGQRQRIGLARAVYGEPVLIVLDEPNSNLDQAGVAALAATLARLKQNGRTVVVIAHDAAILAAATHLLVIREGRMTAFGPKSEVVARTRPPSPVKSGISNNDLATSKASTAA